LANIAPQQCIDIYQLGKNSNWEKAKNLQMKLIQLNTMATGIYGVPGLKFAMDKIGLYGGAARSPLLPINNSAEVEIELELKKLNLL
jgi:4-hydroxy-2-oxoglutarate aldolase